MDLIKDYENADTLSIDTLALEEMVQEERDKEISELNALSKKVSYLHTSLLYYRNPKSKMGNICYDAWRTIVKKLGGTPNGWRDLGHAIGVSQDDLNYIMNSMKDDDPADVVLKVYLQNDNATLDKVLDAFIKLKRYDVLKALEEPLCSLAQCFNKDDSGYHSNGKNSGTREIITFTKNLQNDLPPALCKNYVMKNKEPKKPNQSLQKPQGKPIEKIKNDAPVLFLTFVGDGIQTAHNIQEYVESWEDVSGTTVITLNNQKDEVFQGPEKFIREHFEKADYIVPIVTNGYLDEIQSHSSSIPNTTDNLDFKYAGFIYNLIVNNYIHSSGCLNNKVRSVLPKDADMTVLRNISMYPDLLPWTNEEMFDAQFKEFLKKDYS